MCKVDFNLMLLKHRWGLKHLLLLPCKLANPPPCFPDILQDKLSTSLSSSHYQHQAIKMSNGGIANGVGPGNGVQYDFHDIDDLKLPVRFVADSDVYSSDSVTTTPPNEPRDESAPSSGAAGTAPDEVYARILAPWRATIRRAVIWNLHNESKALARMQRKIRTPFLDKYFVYTSSLGTHTFFMVALPMLFFFGFPDTGRG